MGPSVQRYLEKGMAAHSSILAWTIPWTEEPGGGYSPWGRTESNMTEQLNNNNIQRQKGFKSLEVREYRNASLRSKIEKYWVLPSTWVRKVYGFVPGGWIGMTASFTAYKSWANPSSLWAFWMGRIRVIQGDWQGLMSPCFRNLMSCSWIPLRASGFKGYYLLQGCFSPGLHLISIRGTCFVLSDTEVSQTAGSTCSLISWGMSWGIFWCPTGRSSGAPNRCSLYSDSLPTWTSPCPKKFMFHCSVMSDSLGPHGL